MKWTSLALDCLKDTFGCNPFSTKQAVNALKEEMDYSDNASYQALHGLVKEGFLMRLGRGFYRIPEKKINPAEAISVSEKLVVDFTSGSLIRAEKALKEKGVEFMVTGPSTLSRFHHLLPRRLIHLIYVIDGAGELATTTLREEGLCALLNPKGKEVELLLETFEDRDLFVIREFSKLEGNVGGRAIIEKALVDTYFEATRYRIPFPELEVGRIMANVFRTEKVDIVKLLSLAARRGIANEIRAVVKVLAPNFPLLDVKSERAKLVLKGAME